MVWSASRSLEESDKAWLADAEAYARGGHPDLPGLPDLAVQVREAVANPACTAARLARVIGTDPAIGARVIKVANSAMARGVAPIHSLDRAIARLGLDLVRTLVTGVCVARLFSVPKGEQAEALRVYQRSARAVAVTAYAVAAAQTCGLDPDEVLLAGLVHDIGVLPLLAFMGREPPPGDSAEKRRSLLWHGHPRAGAALLESWHFDGRFVACARHHERIYWPRSGPADLLDAVVVANVEVHDGSDGPHGAVDRRRIPAYGRLGLDAASGLAALPGWSRHLEAARLRLAG